MTVSELIEVLSEVRDKSVPVFVYDSSRPPKQYLIDDYGESVEIDSFALWIKENEE